MFRSVVYAVGLSAHAELSDTDPASSLPPTGNAVLI